jgi:HSP20 family molecular chaperone IbpA
MLSPFFAWDLFDEPSERRPQWSMLNNFSPVVDIKETPRAITLRCEMAGIPPESVHLDFNDGCIIIRGYKRPVQEADRYEQQQQLGGQGQQQSRQGPGQLGQPSSQMGHPQQGLQGQQQGLQQGQQGFQGQQQGFQGQGLTGTQGQGATSMPGQTGERGLERGLEKVSERGTERGTERFGERQGQLSSQSGMQRESEKDVQWHRVESACGEFRRSFRLPRGVNAKNISAHSKHGVLEIVVTKPNELQKETGERINIASAT